MKTQFLYSFIALTLLSLVAVNLGTAHAQDTAFTYQGRLQNNGNPANGSYDLQFVLFTTNQFGIPAAPILTNAAVTVNNGLFTTTLDFGAGVFNGTNYWLDISVRTNGSGTFAELSPRQPITPTPYAITAANLSGVLENNSIQGGVSLATISGGGGNSIQTGANNATIGGGNQNTIQTNDNSSTIGGGQANTIGTNANFSNIGGGSNNFVSGPFSFIGGGENNTVNGTNATVGGGFRNTASGQSSTVGGGANNKATATTATVSGGIGNTASGTNANVNGGFQNTASGFAATVPGGELNTAGGNFSFAAGREAQATNNGSFVWADSQFPVGVLFSSTSTNQFLIRAGGGVGINTANPQQALSVVGGLCIDQGDLNSGNDSANALTFGSISGEGIASQRTAGTGKFDLVFYTAFLPRVTILANGAVGIGTANPDALLSVNGTADKPGGGSWSTFSDGRLKDIGANFTHGLEALDDIQPIHYHYKSDNPLNLPSGPDYIGVVAQQVQKVIPEAVHSNQNGYLVVNNDPIIWTMFNAIKELNQQRAAETKSKDAEIQSLKQQNDALAERLNELEAAVKSIARKK